MAEQLVELANQQGLSGPPVDVFGLASALGIQLRPKDDLLDARIIATEMQDLVIEYNPSRPRGRLRFSIAHEIAHSRFADVADRPRHRTAAGSIADVATDDWELELVCDVIAADLLIPGQAVEGLLTVDPDIDFIMETRRKWDVSTEALLRRLVEATPRSLTMLATSRPTHLASLAMRVDYVASSARARESDLLAAIGHGDLLENIQPLLNCAAVGQTVRGTVEIAEEKLYLQCVGVPAYPGSQWPRVLALLEREDERLAISGLDFVVSDLLEVAEGRTPVIFAHVVSGSVRTWNHVGAAGTLAKAFPDFAQAFRAWTIASPRNLDLGGLHFVERDIADRKVGVASLVAQEGFGGGGPRLRYDALEESLAKLADLATTRQAEIHLPRLGAGQAGGRWDEVERLVVSYLVDAGLKVVVHTRPSIPYAARTTNG
ncbi:MAG: putative Zn peptidase [Rhodoglobus sp.]|nr:putative Zn peptidase [Rhodoglobus sp.]